MLTLLVRSSFPSAFHNFSRNDRCNSFVPLSRLSLPPTSLLRAADSLPSPFFCLSSCGAFKPTSGSTGSHPRHHRTPSLSPQRYFNPLPSASSHATPMPAPLGRYYTSGPPAPPPHIQQQRSLTTSASNPDFFGAGAGRGLNFPSRGGFGGGGEGGGLGLSGLGGADVSERDGGGGGGASGGNGRTRSVSYAGGVAGRGAGGGRGGGSAGMVPVSLRAFSSFFFARS